MKKRESSFAAMVARECAKEQLRQALESAQDKLIDDRELTKAEKKALYEIAFDILGGHDVRDLLGIKKKTGPRNYSGRPDFCVAVHYWALQGGDSNLLAKKAAHEVSQRWSIAPLRVQKIARSCKTAALFLLPPTDMQTRFDGLN